ncbi:hypothetical protein PTSG_11609 [Salpingoeca rosetta]|uniref:dolichyl-phosphate-mannose--protein mannosyltransferase n=1 Tax=Salpingoeca rosetta (strain ATCC 50818 / BSB-021) TaxID=946362 RepID=F2TWS4_SALR5|nr:uncharacterized protein PTSG_11609 [Salpingoeca rosetta]EGD72520.1 hypothetical protein PTSG_11609 [Salpingoeca rosetta]|eukprot:XP_004999089.1 hypothetical protein PTSG_11609 [Salpingoeca rosetta]
MGSGRTSGGLLQGAGGADVDSDGDGTAEGACVGSTRQGGKMSVRGHEQGTAAIPRRQQDGRQQQQWKLTVTLDVLEITIMATLTLAALATRLYNIHQPPSVAWDETHFGKFANRYLKRQFYFDVHPPLAKMLIALAGLVTGYRGDFSFEGPGTPYDNDLYIGMRVFCACVGAMCVPLAYLTLRQLSCSRVAAITAASLVLFDTACITASKYILLDPILMFFIHAACCAALYVRRQRHRAFSAGWWVSYAVLGVLLGCAISSKWVGLFVVLFTGCLTIADLWELWGDTAVSLMRLALYFLARAATLIVLPLAVYAFFFFVHFAVCNHSGDGDSFMSSAFQTTLIGNELNATPMPNTVAVGSVVSIKGARCSGGLLHSHPHLYPAHMVQQQQITAYQHKDDNNLWIIKRGHEHTNVNVNHSNGRSEVVSFVHSGDIIRLEHKLTRVNLHSHGLGAFSKKTHHQVTGYGVNGTGDINDNWTVEVVRGRNGDQLGRITDQFKLLHSPFGTPICALSCDGTKYPEWGFEQLEVTCNPNLNDTSNLWNIERHDNPLLPAEDVSTVKPSFWQNLHELHVAMAEVNNGLVPKKDEDPSRAWHWPINYRGQRFTAWGDNDLRVYLLGNPVVFAINLIAIVLFIVGALLVALARQRGVQVSTTAVSDGGWLFLGWALHYLPFFLMGRVLYFHHYLPALLFSCMLTGVVVDALVDVVLCAVVRRAGNKRVPVVGVRAAVLVALIAVLAWSFRVFSCMAYGMQGPLRSMKPLMWMQSWELDH